MSFATLATRNFSTVLAEILIFCCVLGLKPVRAFLFCFTSLPKLGRTNSYVLYSTIPFPRKVCDWKDRESGEWLRTCTIITGEPNKFVAQIHPRMPVILAEQHLAAWLGETENGNLGELLLRHPADQMRMWEIFPRVNSVGE